MEMEARGVPTVMVHTEAFATLAESALTYRQYGHVPRYVLPRLLDNMTDDEVRAVADAQAMDIVHRLLNPEGAPGG
jgi:cysteine synthase